MGQQHGYCARLSAWMTPEACQAYSKPGRGHGDRLTARHNACCRECSAGLDMSRPMMYSRATGRLAPRQTESGEVAR